MKKPSEIIKGSCCGALLDIPVCQLAKQVETLENQNKNLFEANKRILKERDNAVKISKRWFVLVLLFSCVIFFV